MNFLKKYGPFIWMGVIFILSHQPNEELPKWEIPHLDKIVHFVLYSTLTFFWLWRLSKRFTLTIKFLFILISIAVYGALDEFHQSFIPGREVDLWDWIVNVASGAFMIGVYYFVRHKNKKESLPT